MPRGIDHTELWPYDTAYSFPVGLAGIYALLAAAIAAGTVAAGVDPGVLVVGLTGIEDTGQRVPR